MASIFPADTVFRKTRELLESEVNDEVVALDVDKGQCYGLNAVGSRVWRLLETPKSLDEICSELQVEYEIEPDMCVAQVGGLLNELKGEGLVEIVDR
jgi:hypothetical protein